MKKSIFLTVFLFSFLNFSAFAQSQSVREIEVNNDDGSVLIKFEDNELVKLKIDGKTISPKDYNLYYDLIQKHSRDTPAPPTPPSTDHYEVNVKQDEGELLNEEILKILVDNNLITNRKKYKFNFSPNRLRVNGKKMNREMLGLCLEAFEDVYGYELPSGSEYSVKIKRNSRSISFSIED